MDLDNGLNSGNAGGAACDDRQEDDQTIGVAVEDRQEDDRRSR